jgi:hypothetical protein
VLKEELAGIAHWGILDDDFLGNSCQPKDLNYPQIRSINYMLSKGMSAGSILGRVS